MQYSILVSFDLEKVFPSVDSTLNEINKHMKCFGFNEKLSLRSEQVEFGTLTVSSDILPETLLLMCNDFVKSFLEKYPDSRVEVEIVPKIS
jgi:hypothetical protein